MKVSTRMFSLILLWQLIELWFLVKRVRNLEQVSWTLSVWWQLILCHFSNKCSINSLVSSCLNEWTCYCFCFITKIVTLWTEHLTIISHKYKETWTTHFHLRKGVMGSHTCTVKVGGIMDSLLKRVNRNYLHPLATFWWKKELLLRE